MGGVHGAGACCTCNCTTTSTRVAITHLIIGIGACRIITYRLRYNYRPFSPLAETSLPMTSVAQVVEFLENNPHFLEENPHLLPPSQTDGTARDNAEERFAARKLEVLKQREDVHKARLDELVDTASANQKLEDELLTLCIDLLAGGNDIDSLEAITAALKKQFALAEVVILSRSAWPAPTCECSFAELQPRVAHLSSVCDDRLSSALKSRLFGVAVDIGSCAFVPLVFADDIQGIMVFAATDPRRFTPDMGVDYLDRIGRVIAAYITGVRWRPGAVAQN